MDMDGTRIIWEAKGQPTVFADTYTFTPGSYGSQWVEVEVQWPDGRRAFATNSVTVSINAPPQLSNPQRLTGGGFSFVLAGTPLATYVIQASATGGADGHDERGLFLFAC